MHDTPNSTRELASLLVVVIASLVAAYAAGKAGVAVLWLGMALEWLDTKERGSR